MNARRLVSQIRLNEWSEQVKERIASGQTVKSFCEEHSIHQSTYYHRQKRVREAAIAAIARDQMQNGASNSSMQTGLSIPSIQNYPSIPQGWTELSEVRSKSKDSEEYLMIEIGEFKVKVTHNTNPELLSKTCRMLVQLC